jgi:hypothetical protein
MNVEDGGFLGFFDTPRQIPPSAEQSADVRDDVFREVRALEGDVSLLVPRE